MKAAHESGPEPNTEFGFFFTFPLPYSLAFLEMLFNQLTGKSFQCPIVLTVKMLFPALMANLHFRFKPLHLVITFSATVNNLRPLLYRSPFPRIETVGRGVGRLVSAAHILHRSRQQPKESQVLSLTLCKKCCYLSFHFSHLSAYLNDCILQCCGVYAILGNNWVNAPVRLSVFTIVMC